MPLGVISLRRMTRDRLSSKSAEHLTPPHIVKAVLDVLGEIDLDPCAEASEDPHIPAKRHYTLKEDGLKQVWLGRVYMNPPYGNTGGGGRKKESVLKWMLKMATEFREGRVTEGIVLWRASTGTRAWVEITSVASRICFLRGRLSFVAPGNDQGASFDSVIFYLGPNGNRFDGVFTRLGQVWDTGNIRNAQSSLGEF